ncbi:MAG: ferredoxin:thioredoxin reductase [Candidatus Helarchaeota archaeon]|nr:ferredoxin:thioredoxin reductase [Candidatus Helarchaeota archaeon]
MGRTLETAEKIANKKGWKVNPDRKAAQEIIDGLNKNKEIKGRYYCPCKLVTGDPEVDKDIICPCKDSQKEIDAMGHCHCGLFYKK